MLDASGQDSDGQERISSMAPAPPTDGLWSNGNRRETYPLPPLGPATFIFFPCL